jgi:Subtilase family
MDPASRRWVRVALVTGLIAAGVFPAVAHRHPRQVTTDHVAKASARPLHTFNTLLVGLDSVPIREVLSSVRGYGRGRVRVLDRIPDLSVAQVHVPHQRIDAVERRLESSGSFRFVEREGKALASTTPNDPYFPWTGSDVLYGGQWGDGLTQAQKAWDITTGSPNVIVAVVDSGIDDAHPDLSGQLVPGTSIVGGSTIDTSGHGEYVAGVIAPNTNNGIGVAGYCWTCKLMPIKITDGGSATYSAMADGIVWATDHGARVINVSYAGTSSSSTLNSAVSYATNHGSIVVAAAGNSGCNCATYPAASPGALAVAASDQSNNLMNYSNFGSWVQVAAPTGDMTTWLVLNGIRYGYDAVGGTSISAPVVAGILALLLSYAPNATVAQLKDALFSSVDPITGLTQSGSKVSIQYGRVNAYKALLALGGSAPSSSPSRSPSPSASPTVSSSPSPSSSAGSPTPTGTSSTSSSSSPTPGDSPTSTSSPAPQVLTFSGSLNKQSTTRLYSVTLAAGAVHARLSFKRSPSLDLALLDDASTVVAEQSGPSVVTLDIDVASGSYVFSVSGDRGNFTLAVTVTAA